MCFNHSFTSQRHFGENRNAPKVYNFENHVRFVFFLWMHGKELIMLIFSKRKLNHINISFNSELQ